MIDNIRLLSNKVACLFHFAFVESCVTDSKVKKDRTGINLTPWNCVLAHTRISCLWFVPQTRLLNAITPTTLWNNGQISSLIVAALELYNETLFFPVDWYNLFVLTSESCKAVGQWDPSNFSQILGGQLRLRTTKWTHSVKSHSGTEGYATQCITSIQVLALMLALTLDDIRWCTMDSGRLKHGCKIS